MNTLVFKLKMMELSLPQTPRAMLKAEVDRERLEMETRNGTTKVFLHTSELVHNPLTKLFPLFIPFLDSLRANTGSVDTSRDVI
jgi:hypothetical protein